jgi:hypothetical protein
MLIDAQLDPACLVDAAIDSGPIVALGQRTEALSGRKRRARPPARNRLRYSGSAKSGKIGTMLPVVIRREKPDRDIFEFW